MRAPAAAPGLHALLLCPASDAAKWALALREAKVEPLLVNADATHAYAHAHLAGGNLPVAYDLHRRLRAPLARYLRYGFALATPLAGAALRLAGTGRDLDRLRERTGHLDFALAHWGTGVLPELALVRRSRAFRDLPSLLNLETFPTAWRAGAREAAELVMLRRAAPLLDGVLVPTAEMAELLERAAPELGSRTHIQPFWFPRAFAGDTPPAIPGDDEHDVVFTGWLDLQHSLNDVRPELRALAEAGLRVHCTRTEGLEHANLRFFAHFDGERMTAGGFADFVRRFRASLVTYRLAARAPALRFATSLPSRFLFSLAAGVPVLLPRGRFAAMERMVVEAGIGLPYDSPDEVFARLRGPDWQAVQRRAFESRQRFWFDAERFRALLLELLGRPARACA